MRCPELLTLRLHTRLINYYGWLHSARGLDWIWHLCPIESFPRTFDRQMLLISNIKDYYYSPIVMILEFCKG